jgi:hypothetical protein
MPIFQYSSKIVLIPDSIAIRNFDVSLHQGLNPVQAFLSPSKFEFPDGNGIRDQNDFGAVLKNGHLLCELINKLGPGSVKKINTMNAPFKQRENIEMFLKGCESYGLVAQDLFQVNDL